MAGATQAYGAVVVVPNPGNIVGHSPDGGAFTSVGIDLNGDGLRDLRILYSNTYQSGGTLLLGDIYVGNGLIAGAPVATVIGGQSYSFSLATGTSVGPGSSFYQKTPYSSHIVANYNGTALGLGNPTGTPITVGFEFQSSRTAGAPFDYGYITLEVDPYVDDSNPGGIQFFKLAYDDSGAPITVGGNAAVPEPTSLAALAFGVVGLAGAALQRRRRRLAQA